MGSTLRDRARRGAKTGPNPEETPASAEVEESTEPSPEAGDAETDESPDTQPQDGAEVVDITAKAIAKLSDDQINAFLEAHKAEPEAVGIAVLTATRETKANQVQYDGKTPDGYVIRVWAPGGAPMVVGAQLIADR